MELFFVLVPGLLILYAVWILCLQKKAKELKKKLWDNAGYKTTKNISTLYIDKNKKSWYVIGCPRVYKYSDIKYCQIIKNKIKHNTVNRIEMQVYVHDPNLPVVRMVLLNSQVSTNSYTYHSIMNMAREIDIEFKSMRIFRDCPEKTTVKHLDEPKIEYSKIEASPNDYVVFDLETTGLNKYDDKIIEIGAIKYINGVESEKFHTYVNPQRHIPSAATNINGISDRDVKNAPKAEKALSDFLSFIDNYTLIAYNSDFDMGFIQIECSNSLGKTVKNDVIDALPLARKYLPQLPNKKLVTVKNYFNLDVGSHNAIDDCIVTNHLYQYCRQFEELKYKYAVKFSYDPRELSDKEVEYLNTIVNICEKSNINKSQLSMRTSGTLLVIEKNNEQLVSIKLNGKLQYVLLQIPFEKFEEKYPTEIKHTPSSKSEGNYTRLFTTSSEQLWQFESAIIKKSQKNWTTENK